jgi:DNA-binding transcriptional MerR regulator
MAARAFTKKTPYLDTEDTLEEVGVSRRQLNYWREKELFSPELGDDAKKFTEKDIKLLKFARRLIVEQQFPVEVAKRLISAATSSDSAWEQIELEDFQYLDIQSGTLLSKKSLESILWNAFGATANEHDVESRLYDLMLLLFRLVRSTRPSPAVYMERCDEIIRQLHGWERAARLGWGPTSDNPEPHIHFDPKLDDERDDLAHPEEWLLAADKRLRSFELAASEHEAAQWGNWGRFYTTDAVAAAHEAMNPPSAQTSPTTMDEVPWDDDEPPF